VAVTDVLIDTNAYVAFKQGHPDAIEIVRRATHLALSSTVIGELLAGFAVGSREALNRVELQRFLESDRVHILIVDDGTAAYYANVYRLLRSKGRPIPTNDMWIAAAALQHGHALFTYDSHFEHVDGLLVGATATTLLLP
jgi:tRNA(fMet)-specific endonuclease VapC